MNEPDHPTIGTKLLATVETAFCAFMAGKDAPPLQPADSTQAAWERFRACLMVADREVPPVRAVTASILFGDWYLVRVGDKWGISHGDPEDGYLPAMTWTNTPAVDPCEGMTDDEVNALPPDEAERRIIGHQKQVEAFRTEATLDVGEAAHFVEAAQSAGWDQGSHGDLAHWVFERAGALIGAVESSAAPVAAASSDTWAPGKASGRCPHCDSGHMERRVVRALSGSDPTPVMICIGGCGRSEAVTAR